MPKKRGDKFISGSGGVYTCGCCSKKTRDTGRGENDSGQELCAFCYEAAGFENMFVDFKCTYVEYLAHMKTLQTEFSRTDDPNDLVWIESIAKDRSQWIEPEVEAPKGTEKTVLVVGLQPVSASPILAGVGEIIKSEAPDTSSPVLAVDEIYPLGAPNTPQSAVNVATRVVSEIVNTLDYRNLYAPLHIALTDAARTAIIDGHRHEPPALKVGEIKLSTADNVQTVTLFIDVK